MRLVSFSSPCEHVETNIFGEDLDKICRAVLPSIPGFTGDTSLKMWNIDVPSLKFLLVNVQLHRSSYNAIIAFSSKSGCAHDTEVRPVR